MVPFVSRPCSSGSSIVPMFGRAPSPIVSLVIITVYLVSYIMGSSCPPSGGSVFRSEHLRVSTSTWVLLVFLLTFTKSLVLSFYMSVWRGTRSPLSRRRSGGATLSGMVGSPYLFGMISLTFFVGSGVLRSVCIVCGLGICVLLDLVWLVRLVLLI